MRRATAKKINVILYICLMITIPIMVYLETMNYLLLSIILVCIMFAISMFMVWLSTREHENEDKKIKEKRLLN
jgi:Na+/melibiose symporter-like transporter